MDITALRSFREVCRKGSISAAAQDLGYTQSALSRQIATLESRLGARLMHRHARGVRPTPAGEVLLEHGEVILRRIERAEEDVHSLRHRPAARLRIGTIPSAAAVLLPRVLTTFRAERPDVRTGLVEDSTPALLSRLLDGDLDVAVVSDCRQPAATQEGVVLTPVLEDELFCVLPRGHRLAGPPPPEGTPTPPGPGVPAWPTAGQPVPSPGPAVDLADLAEESWVGGRADATLLGRACAQAGFTPHVDIECDDWLSKQAFVAAGAGVTLVPRLLLPALRPDLVVRPLRDPPRRSVRAATRERRRATGGSDGPVEAATRTFLAALCGAAGPERGAADPSRAPRSRSAPGTEQSRPLP